MHRICALTATEVNTMQKVIKMTNGDKFRNMSNKQIAELFPDWCDICERIFGGEDLLCPKSMFNCNDCYLAREKYLEQGCSEN